VVGDLRCFGFLQKPEPRERNGLGVKKPKHLKIPLEYWLNRESVEALANDEMDARKLRCWLNGAFNLTRMNNAV